MTVQQTPAPDAGKVSLREIARAFLTIGTIGFGGGMAVVALIQDHCVVRRRWLEPDEFSHGIALGQILGPFAVNASIFVGYRLRGLQGAVVAAVSFLIPSVTLVIILSALYVRFHHVPSLQAALKGIGPVVVALIIAAAWQMGKAQFRSLEFVLLMVVAIALTMFLKLQTVPLLLLAAAYAFLKIRFAKGGKANEGA
ncbi:MAG: chromate transporter [Armatimonadia bacterium]